ncbi:MAG: hypothetical protein HQK63_14545 [Desulfamplus sp.]|nr:hypothetical protein [Desulfamplus sp.]
MKRRLGAGRRPSKTGKPVVEHQRAIHIKNLKHLKNETAFSISYPDQSTLKAVLRRDRLFLILIAEGKIKIKTVLNLINFEYLGRSRKYLLCPNCKKKFNSLYFNDKNIIACRFCHGLSYRTQKQIRQDRLIWNAEKLRLKYNLPPIFNTIHDKDKPDEIFKGRFKTIQDKIYQWESESHKIFMNWVKDAVELDFKKSV